MASTGTTGANVLLDSVMRWARLAPDASAFSAASCQDTTYAQLWGQACVIAHGLDAHLGGRGPVLVLGRKTATTVASFLACLMSGHAYVPVDVSLPVGCTTSPARSRARHAWLPASCPTSWRP